MPYHTRKAKSVLGELVIGGKITGKEIKMTERVEREFIQNYEFRNESDTRRPNYFQQGVEHFQVNEMDRLAELRQYILVQEMPKENKAQPAIIDWSDENRRIMTSDLQNALARKDADRYLNYFEQSKQQQ